MDPGTLSVALIFGIPIIAILTGSRTKRAKLAAQLEMARLSAKQGGGGLAPEERKQLEGRLAQLEKVQDEKRLLEARVQNLETIVCSVDFELNQRLNRLAAEQSRAGLLAAPQMATSAASATPAALAAGGGAGSLATDATAMAPAAAFLGGGLRTGQVLVGRYTIERELGRGGMGSVYLARDSQLGERVAVKVIAASLAGDPAGAAERFRREVAAARKITHPNVIRIHDLGQDGPMLFLSMEYVEGPTLAAHLGKVGTLPVADAADFLRQIADGMAAAHAAGVVHRDLKPQNVLLTPERRAKIIDFGLANASFFAGAGMTATGMILGTPEYMAPEQVRGRPCDARTDVYALGGIGYHLLAGRPPFAGETPIAVGFAHVSTPPRPIADLRPETPPALAAAIMRALEKEPAARFADAAELRAALA